MYPSDIPSCTERIQMDLAGYRNRVFRFLCRYVKVTEEAEDLTQDVMLKILLNADKFENVTDVDSYILKIAHNTVMDHFKKLHNDQHFREQVWSEIVQSSNTVIKEVYRADLLDNVERVLSSLSPRQQAIYRMNRMDGMSLEEIGKALSISSYTAKNHLAQALKYVRSRLNPESFLVVALSWLPF